MRAEADTSDYVSLTIEYGPDQGIDPVRDEEFELVEQFFFAAGEALAHLPDPPPPERFDEDFYRPVYARAA